MFADTPALVHGERRYSYRELGQRVNRLASTRGSLGVDRHDRVAVLAPNTPAMVEAHFGVPAAGGVLVSINTRLGPAEVATMLSHADPRVLLVDAEYEPLLAGAGHSAAHVIRIDDTGTPAIPTRISWPRAPPRRPEPGSRTRKRRSPSTTPPAPPAGPKGVDVHPPRRLPERARRGDRGRASGRESVLLWTLPMFHCNGWCFPWAVTALARRTSACAESTRTDLGAHRRRGRHPLQRRADRADSDREPPGAHRLERPTVTTGGAPPSPTLLARMESSTSTSSTSTG